MLNITNLKETVESIITNSALTHEQAMIALSDVPLSYVEFFETTNEFRELCEAGCLCRMAEGNVTYQPRYILPDYEKLMREGANSYVWIHLKIYSKRFRHWKSFIVMSHQLHIIRFTWDL